MLSGSFVPLVLPFLQGPLSPRKDPRELRAAKRSPQASVAEQFPETQWETLSRTSAPLASLKRFRSPTR